MVTAELGAAIAAAQAAVAVGPDGVGTAAEAIELLEAVEHLSRLAAVARVDAFAVIDQSGAYRDHGHATTRAMFKHVGRVSSTEAARVAKIARMCAHCDQINAAWRAGQLSVDSAAVLGRAYANPRIREAMVDAQDWFLAQAERPFHVFEKRVAAWVSLTDEDGAAPRPDPGHTGRDVVMVQDHFSKHWTLRGTFGSFQGAQIKRVLDAYGDAEFHSDWEAAQSVHGDATCRDVLDRSDGQRRADAFAQIVADALHNPNRSVPIDTCHNVIWAGESLEEMIRRFAGAEPANLDLDTHVCRTLDGSPLDETTAFADFLVSKFRRVVQNAKSVCVDMGESQRFFTGLARLGVQLSFDSCYWPCDVPVDKCQIDHLIPAARGGPTDQCNGGPACEHHNRIKERGYTVRRLDDGTIEITTPNGDIVPP